MSIVSMVEMIEAAKVKARGVIAQREQHAKATDEHVAHVIDKLAGRGYIPTGSSVEAVRDYLNGYGLLLTGSAGVGKTYLLRLLGLRIWTATDICDYGMRHIQQWFEDTRGKEIAIDDIGTEITVSEYGAKDDIMKLVIAYRCERQRGRTHVTTNLDAAGIIDRYGDRTMSRLLGMCRAHKIISPDGMNMRKATPHSTATGG